MPPIVHTSTVMVSQHEHGVAVISPTWPVRTLSVLLSVVLVNLLSFVRLTTRYVVMGLNLSVFVCLSVSLSYRNGAPAMWEK